MKKISIVMILSLLFLMTSCADFAQIGGSFSHDYDMAETGFKTNIILLIFLNIMVIFISRIMSDFIR